MNIYIYFLYNIFPNYFYLPGPALTTWMIAGIDNFKSQIRSWLSSDTDANSFNDWINWIIKWNKKKFFFYLKNDNCSKNRLQII